MTSPVIALPPADSHYLDARGVPQGYGYGLTVASGGGLVRSDFRASAARLDTVRVIHERALDATYEILARAGLGGQPQSDLPTAELAWHPLRAWTYDPVLGGINSLIHSGGLGLLTDDSLRVAVAGWPDIVEDPNGDELRENANTFEQLVPHLVTRGAMLDGLTSVGALNRLDVQPTSDQSELLSDPLYLQMMGWRVNGLENVLAEVENRGPSRSSTYWSCSMGRGRNREREA